jgi:ATP-dependent Zn protease
VDAPEHRDAADKTSPPAGRTSAPLWPQLLAGFGPTLLFVGLWVFLMRRAGGGLGGGMFGFGRSKARRVDLEPGRRTNFDVAGIDEVNSELVEIVDMSRHPDRYRRLGALIPKVVLLAPRRAPARPCWPEQWPARPVCRSSPRRHRSS